MRAALLEPRILILCPKSRERCCLAMAFIFRKPRTPCQITNFNLSGSRGARSSPPWTPVAFWQILLRKSGTI